MASCVALNPDRCLDRITVGDSRVLARDIPDESIDLIFTDPPYLKANIEDGIYAWLAQEAARVLKPGGFCLAYTCCQWLPLVLEQMQAHLTFFWMCILRHGNAASYMHHKRVIVRYTPIVAFVKGKGAPQCAFLDCATGSGADKRYHIWGQDERTASYYIDCFSSSGDVVWEPFCGGGTVPVVCRQLDRRCLAFEIDPDAAARAQARLSALQPRLPGIVHQQSSFGEELVGVSG
jgi:DNA modification methylase